MTPTLRMLAHVQTLLYWFGPCPRWERIEAYLIARCNR